MLFYSSVAINKLSNSVRYRAFIVSWIICVLYGYQRATKNDYILFQTNCGYLFLCIQDFYRLPMIKKLKTKILHKCRQITANITYVQIWWILNWMPFYLVSFYPLSSSEVGYSICKDLDYFALMYYSYAEAKKSHTDTFLILTWPL